jgi:preprotein translocase subunit SecA
MSLLKLLDPNSREVKHHRQTAAAIGKLEPDLQALSADQLRQRADDLRARATNGEDLEDLLVESFALTREASVRTIGLRHFDVQLIGGVVLHQGKIAEMKTGEGKTLVASLPLVLNALAGRGVHLVTVNDYLGRRDAGWMGPLYHSLGLSTGVVVGDPSQPDGSFMFDPEYLDETHPDERLQHLRPVSRQEAYRCDITYGTNAQFGFDYLRDNTAVDLAQRSQRDLHYAIVDEVDSILIDEARTPHIISGQAEESTDKYYEYARYAARLEKEVDYIVEEKYKSASLTEEGIVKMQRMAGVRNIYDLEHVVEAHQINQALKAKALFHRDTHYLVRNGEAVIVDEFTGRTMPGRRWSDGLHQAVEAKEGLKVQQETKTLATITLQNYFRLYEKLAGMTGTALTEAEEFHKIYGLEVVEIPTHMPMRRDDSADVIYKTEQSKFNAVIDEIIEMNKQGRPVLVGTVSVDKSERLSRLLEKRGIPHNVLNAKQHEREAAIVVEAGQTGAVTIATNMAGRGTDIVLGSGVAASGGLHIIGTERHESRRIDNQLRGRAGRQGDPGSSKFYISLEDDLMRIFGPAADRIGALMDRLEVEPIEHKWVAGSIENAQKKVEGMNFDTRKHVVEYDDVMSKQRAIIYDERTKVLNGADTSLDGANTRENILAYTSEIIDQGVEAHCEGRHPENWDIDGLVNYLRHYFPLAEGDSIPDEVVRAGRPAITELLRDASTAAYEAKEAEAPNPEWFRGLERFIMLTTIDQKWIDYLTSMEHFREGIGLRAYGQRDPLVEYKSEAFTMFNELTESIRADIVTRMFHVQFVREEPPPQARSALAGRGPNGHGPNGHADGGAAAPVGAGAATGKIGRNDPCWCGSGRKYKRCHGR